MNLKLIACEVFYREVCLCIAQSPHVIDVEFTEKGAHDQSDKLRSILQRKVDEASSGQKRYDAILLCFGICGNSTVGIQARDIPIVIPRAHDCCTIFLGSKQAFKEHFGNNPSQPFSSAGYMERGENYLHESEMGQSIGMYKTYEEYVELYGEDNAKFLMETFKGSLEKTSDNKLYYIEIPETAHLGFAEKCRDLAARDGKEFVALEGSMRLIRKMLDGKWDGEDFLIVKPDQSIAGVYDLDEVVRAEKAGGNKEK